MRFSKNNNDVLSSVSSNRHAVFTLGGLYEYDAVRGERHVFARGILESNLSS